MDSDLERALVILTDLVFDDPCSLDHDGNCQAHNWFGQRECPYARGQRLLARLIQ